MIIAALLSGCANSEESSGDSGSSTTVEQSSPTSSESSQSSDNSADDNNSDVTEKTVKVTSIDGNAVTAEVGELSQTSAQPGGTPPDMPNGDASGNEGGTPPEMPNGEAPSNSGGEPPQMSGGQGGQGGMSFASSGETLTFNVTDGTEITVEFLQGSGEGSLDDVAVGSVLDVTLDADNNAVKLTIRNLNAGGGFGGSQEVTNGTSANTIDENGTVSDTEYSSSGDDENALRIDGAEVILENLTVNKNGGSSSNTENGDFYGQNAALLALNGAQVTIKNSTFDTNAVNGNAVFSYGEGTVVNISDCVIRTSQNNSGGIQTTGGGTTNAYNLDVQTEGNSAAAIRSDRGGGTVYVEGGKFVTNGTGSPAVYCTADITVNGAALTANAGEGIVVEGKNSVALENCTVIGKMSNTYNGDSGENIHCIMIYQSMSGDADLGEASFAAKGGSITSLSGDMFYITNTDCTITLENVEFTLANDTFLRVEGNDSSRGWGTVGANGGDVILNANSQKIGGNIIVDEISSLDLTLSGGSEITGAINSENSGGTVKVTLENSTWTLTADSYVSEFNGDISSVAANGHHLYVNGEQIV
ncbi:MAG: hypothetical protein NC299_11115 [Lachnospiraceae bacterium]|nr:hypothetical protein [Lachnospiraceae bacterium]